MNKSRLTAVMLMLLAPSGFGQVIELSSNLRPQPINTDYYVRGNPIALTLKSDWYLDKSEDVFVYPTTKYVMFAHPTVSAVRVTYLNADGGVDHNVNANITGTQTPELIKISIPKPHTGTYKAGSKFYVQGIMFDVWNGSDPNGCKGSRFLDCAEVVPGDFIGIVVTSHDSREVVTFTNPEINAVRVAPQTVRR